MKTTAESAIRIRYFHPKYGCHAPTRETAFASQKIDSMMDLQLIPWGVIDLGTREEFRESYNNSYTMYRCRKDLPLDRITPKPKCNPGFEHFVCDEFYNELSISIPHFQLRQGITATTDHNVLFLSEWGVTLLNDITGNSSESFGIPPSNEYVTLTSKDSLVFVGSNQGTIILYDLSSGKVVYSGKITRREDIVNHGEFAFFNGGLHLSTASNDGYVRIFDVQTMNEVFSHHFQQPVNACTVSPDKSLIATYCDKIDSELIDIRTRQIVTTLQGHKDFGFSLAWHPNGTLLATTNQDGTCRVWDIRNPQQEYEKLQGTLSNTNSVKFSGSGEFLAFCENTDYVHIYSVKDNFQTDQEIDVFGRINGLSFDPDDGDSLYFGVNIKDYSGVFKWSKRRIESTTRLMSMEIEDLLL